MKVKVLFFGATADSVGKREIEFGLHGDSNADSALVQIYKALPNLQKNHESRVLHFSINQEYSTGKEVIQEGDELAIFTAVSGG